MDVAENRHPLAVQLESCVIFVSYYKCAGGGGVGLPLTEGCSAGLGGWGGRRERYVLMQR